jgi:hypothetical protein
LGLGTFQLRALSAGAFCICRQQYLQTASVVPVEPTII